MLRKDLNKYFDTYHHNSLKEFKVPEYGYLAQFNMRDNEQNIVAVFDADPDESFEDVLSSDFNYVTEYMVKVKTLCFISPETKFPVFWHNTPVQNSDNDNFMCGICLLARNKLSQLFVLLNLAIRCD